MRVSAAILLFLSACCLAVTASYDRPAGARPRQLSSAALLLARADGSSASASLSLVSAAHGDAPASRALRGAPLDGEISASCGAGFVVPKLRLNLRGGARRVYDDAEDEEDDEDEEEGSEEDDEVSAPLPNPGGVRTKAQTLSGPAIHIRPTLVQTKGAEPGPTIHTLRSACGRIAWFGPLN